MSTGLAKGGVSLDPRDHNWETALELDGGVALPDCRLRPLERDKAKLPYGRIQLDQVFCASCGKPHGGVFPDCPHVFFICDDCVGRNGPPPGCAEIPAAAAPVPKAPIRSS